MKFMHLLTKTSFGLFLGTLLFILSGLYGISVKAKSTINGRNLIRLTSLANSTFRNSPTSPEDKKRPASDYKKARVKSRPLKVVKNAKTNKAKTFTCTNPPSPGVPNGGLVVGCSLGESISISAVPTLPSSPSDPCYFHCGIQWNGPSNWLFTVGNYNSGYGPFWGSQGGPGLDPMIITVPSSGVSNGQVGTVSITAYYSDCNAPYNTSSSAILWYGPASVSNGTINGNFWNGGTYYVPSGYCNLAATIGGASSINWYVANGSGSLYTSGSNCSVSFSNFVRVVVEASNRCSGGGSWTFYLSTQEGYSGYRVGPNPGKDVVSLLLDYDDMAGTVIQGITLYDESRKACYQADAQQLTQSFSGKSSIEISTKDLARGTYYLHVKVGNEVEKHQIILE
ncbi:hypothetical protein GCM10023187_36300 [Nibrella viscosa]|uniref:Secretion system C-terminal sorting domain-containing protein n=1 Tax=Nibrella viscosa TaxID=1084524 RepID=A0ABP8KNF0_9BACT